MSTGLASEMMNAATCDDLRSIGDADARPVPPQPSLLREPPGRIVVVDDSPTNLLLLERLLEREGHTVLTADDGDTAFELVTRELPDLVLLDVLMQSCNGFDICRALKSQPATRLIPVVLVTALTDAHSKLQGLESGADDFVTKPVNAMELCARVRSLLRIKRYTDDLDSAESVLLTLSRTIEARDAYTEGHCERLARYSMMLGDQLGFDDGELAVLERGGLLHDIGKIGVPDAVLLKPSAITREEHQLVQTHTLIGDRLCSGLRSLSRVRPIVRGHHERLDGTGYPDGLKGDDIPLAAQIIGIADVFDALTTSRAYKPAFADYRAYEELRDEAARGWRRRDLVDMFVSAHQRTCHP